MCLIWESCVKPGSLLHRRTHCLTLKFHVLHSSKFQNFYPANFLVTTSMICVFEEFPSIMALTIGLLAKWHQFLSCGGGTTISWNSVLFGLMSSLILPQSTTVLAHPHTQSQAHSQTLTTNTTDVAESMLTFSIGKYPYLNSRTSSHVDTWSLIGWFSVATPSYPCAKIDDKVV